MRRALIAVIALLAGVLTPVLVQGGVQEAGAATVPCSRPVAPYYFASWGQPQDPVQIMAATGIKCFTIPFVTSTSACQPMWGSQALTGGSEAATIARIRQNGGDVIISSGGANTSASLEVRCSSYLNLFAAYQRVVDTYRLLVLDIDLEGGALANYAIQEKVLGALRLLHARRPALKIVLTIPTGRYGLHSDAAHLLTRAVQTRTTVHVWSVMTFDFGNASTPMALATIQASEALHSSLHRAYPSLTSAQLYSMQGISAMNGVSDTGELTSAGAFSAIRNYASARHIPRLTFWGVNRDRQCPVTGTLSSSCSGVTQSSLTYAKTFAVYR